MMTFQKILLFGVFIAVIAPTAYSLDQSYCANIELTDISPTSIRIGEEFTVGLVVENCGEKIAEVATFELLDSSPYIGVKESKIKQLNELTYANSERFLLYHMKVADDALPGNYLFRYRLRYGGESVSLVKEGNFSVTVIGERAELGIASIATDPVLPYEGDTIELVARIENTGEGIAKSVRVSADHPFQGVKQAFIGSLEPDEDGPVVFTFVANEAGEFTFPVIVSYSDDFGEHTIPADIAITVLAQQSNKGTIVPTVIVVAIILGLLYLLFSMKRSKDKVIQQLLKGNQGKTAAQQGSKK